MLLIDHDGGLDDAMAILLALQASPKPSSGPAAASLCVAPRLLALTTVRGNVSALQAAVNSRLILRIFGREDIPVYAGCEQPIIGPPQPQWEGHGSNGFGGVVFDNSWLPARLRDVHYDDQASSSKEHAVSALVRLLSEHPGSDVIALGPLTNIALAVRLCPSIIGSVRSIVVMGGSLIGRGNSSLSAEYNFLSDPEAANIVVSAFSAKQLALVPWETTEKHALSLQQFEVLTGASTKTARFLKQVCSNYERMVRAVLATQGALPSSSASLASSSELKEALIGAASSAFFACASCSASMNCPRCDDDHPLGFSAAPSTHLIVPAHSHSSEFIMCDAIAMSIYLFPTIVRRSRQVSAAVELSGAYSRGFLAVDWSPAGCSKPPNICAVEEVDHTALLHRWVSLVQYDFEE